MKWAAIELAPAVGDKRNEVQSIDILELCLLVVISRAKIDGS